MGRISKKKKAAKLASAKFVANQAKRNASAITKKLEKPQTSIDQKPLKSVAVLRKSSKKEPKEAKPKAAVDFHASHQRLRAVKKRIDRDNERKASLVERLKHARCAKAEKKRSSTTIKLERYE